MRIQSTCWTPKKPSERNRLEMKRHNLALGFRFHAPTGELGVHLTPGEIAVHPPRWLRRYAELLKMERESREFEAQLQEVQRVANMGRGEMEEMARKAREAADERR